MSSTLSDIFIRIIADYSVVLIVLIAAWVMLHLPRSARYQRIARAVFYGLVSLLFAKVAGLFYQDPARPFQLLGVHPKAAYLSNPGFPSDHMLLVSAIAIAVWASTKNLKWTALLAVMAVVVGIGRILGLVHSPQDVIGSVVCALLAGWVVYGRSLWRRDLPRP